MKINLSPIRKNFALSRLKADEIMLKNHIRRQVPLLHYLFQLLTTLIRLASRGLARLLFRRTFQHSLSLRNKVP
ncbi:hypothetical protein PFLmoz3_04772 [Pseudomonas fluorescens]|uniref:Uncharacterized protein n=1 Tax=Pseudomonas fluorescens TaxID=294 RepID=A0A125QHT7_PSEFL|nr:hypothetical protein PFLmoz3_04772 [Pseudomonas fluorescens]